MPRHHHHIKQGIAELQNAVLWVHASLNEKWPFYLPIRSLPISWPMWTFTVISETQISISIKQFLQFHILKLWGLLCWITPDVISCPSQGSTKPIQDPSYSLSFGWGKEQIFPAWVSRIRTCPQNNQLFFSGESSLNTYL